ncbi:hypothetical protein CERSUDRAFT_96260 [Gelatoporia subvermispora B]|uniref:Cytochrome P450 n=1 Tax=Ceriporiopsis subvermispora (strain B) TaxID=914234 RepID=M2QVC0_CERS8|nr:hypothetical protein CERSUDRAFT_96260 [Gelatoporia subvermispora B]
MPYGGEWRAQRKVAHTALKSAQLKDYYRMQEEIAGRLCKALLSTPEDFDHHIHMSTGGLIIAITSGIPASPVQAGVSGSRYCDVCDRVLK